MGVTHDLRKVTSRPYLASLKSAILDAASQRIKATLRAFQYSMVGVLHPTKNDDDFDQMNRVVRGMRLTGELDWDGLDERHRTLRWRGGHADLPAFIEGLPDGYNRNYTRRQPKRVYILFEADGMTGLIEDIGRDRGVLWASMKGYSSDVLIWKVALDIAIAKKPAHVFVISDHDPDGASIFTDVKNSLPWFVDAAESGWTVKECIKTGGFTFDPYSPVPEPPAYVAPNVTIEHLGVHADLLDDLAARGISPPDEGAKVSRRQAWRSGGYGATQVEAIQPDVWADVITEAVEAHIDLDILDESRRAEAEDRRRLQAISRYLASRERRKAARR